MAEHVAAQILGAVESRLQAIAPVHFVPLHAIQGDSLPAIVVQNIEDESDGFGTGPIAEKHRLSFEVWPLVMASGATFRSEAGVIRAAVEQALLATKNDVQLGGISRPGLSRPSAAFSVDADSIGKPVGGWVLKFTCVYQLSTDAPDTPI